MAGAFRLHCCILLISSMGVAPAWTADKLVLIGQSERAYTLAPDNTRIRGLAFDDVSPHAPRLFVLDRSARIFVYEFDGECD